MSAADTSGLRGGPLWRYGGKSGTVGHIAPHFARAALYVEPFFGAGSVFYHLAPRTYAHEAVNDLDSSIVTFFRVLRDRPDDLIRACSLTPFAREEFAAALEHSSDPLEEARRVWVRSRQGFAGKARTVGDWGRSDAETWNPAKAESKLQMLWAYAARLRDVSIDCVDGAEFVDKWGHEGTMVYCDPPYVPESRKGKSYTHEMSADDHRRLAAALHRSVARGACVAVSGYPSSLYDDLYAGWRTVEVDVALHGARDTGGQRRTEVLWCSYPATFSFTGASQPSLFAAVGS